MTRQLGQTIEPLTTTNIEIMYTAAVLVDDEHDATSCDVVDTQVGGYLLAMYLLGHSQRWCMRCGKVEKPEEDRTGCVLFWSPVKAGLVRHLLRRV